MSDEPIDLVFEPEPSRVPASPEGPRHVRAWAGHGVDRGQDAGAYCVACSDAAGDYVWPCVLPPAPAPGGGDTGRPEYEREKHGPTTFANLAHRMGVVVDPVLDGPTVRQHCVALVREAEANSRSGGGDTDLRATVERVIANGYDVLAAPDDQALLVDDLVAALAARPDADRDALARAYRDGYNAGIGSGSDVRWDWIRRAALSRDTEGAP